MLRFLRGPGVKRKFFFRFFLEVDELRGLGITLVLEFET